MALGRNLTRLETVLFEYSASKSDYYRYCHNILFLFLIFSLSCPSIFRVRFRLVRSCLLCRYDFPWTLTKYIPFYGGAEYHDYHHYVGGQSQSNFASVFTYCDYIYGTDKGYIIQKKLLQQIKEDSKKSNKQSGGEKLD
ncbi:methylsterol monooxygenase 1-2-like [Brassica napus]|uniref:methylsterol monooxygenase 1-2-like n=1 Tax=Brassica napus TaxID=3708 RepID=UPI002078DFCC|nr:methylsterol monooxygenase 1-2-like [Brassica napus]